MDGSRRTSGSPRRSAIELAQSLFYCVLLLASFVDVLWTLSGLVHVSIGGTLVAIPGHLVWIALAYASAGTSLALWVGRPLVSASNLRQTVEADFRFGLVHARENTEAIALIHGDADERGRLLDLLRGVRMGWDRQTDGLTRIVLFTSAYSVLASPFPILVAAPRYIMRLISLGTLMQTAQAFQQVTAALSWPVDNLATIAQWRASVERVLALQESLANLDALLASPGRGASKCASTVRCCDSIGCGSASRAAASSCRR
ncbi:MAG: SbmA/BacA-like family transporter [Rhodospirillales bacterium]